MNKPKTFDTEVRIDAVVEYDYTLGTPPRWDKTEEQHYPGDEPKIDMEVYINVPVVDLVAAFQLVKNIPVIEFTKPGKQMVRIKITNAISRTEYDGLVGDCFTDAEEK